MTVQKPSINVHLPSMVNLSPAFKKMMTSQNMLDLVRRIMNGLQRILCLTKKTFEWRPRTFTLFLHEISSKINFFVLSKVSQKDINFLDGRVFCRTLCLSFCCENELFLMLDVMANYSARWCVILSKVWRVICQRVKLFS